MRIFTNQEFAQRVGIDHTHASRLRNGQRLPSADLLHRIHLAFDIPLDRLHKARNDGADAFGRLLRSRVFGDRKHVFRTHCDEDGCDGKHWAKGKCHYHYGVMFRSKKRNVRVSR